MYKSSGSAPAGRQHRRHRDHAHAQAAGSRREHDQRHGRVNYGDQSRATKPNASLLYSWKNPEATFGIAVAAQHYEEKVDRQGDEIFGYSRCRRFRTPRPWIPRRWSDELCRRNQRAYFQQTRKRDSITANLQFKPNDKLEFDLNGLYIQEDFDNFNQSVYSFLSLRPAEVTS